MIKVIAKPTEAHSSLRLEKFMCFKLKSGVKIIGWFNFAAAFLLLAFSVILIILAPQYGCTFWGATISNICTLWGYKACKDISRKLKIK